MGRGECGRPPDKMRAGVGYSEFDAHGAFQKTVRAGETRQGNRKDSPGFERLGEGKALPSLPQGTADKAASGRDGQAQPQSALKILQQQLESFQAHRQQTLENVIMVQSEISGILNKKISDINTSEFNLNNICLSSKPINTTMSGEHQETSHLKKHFHNRSHNNHCPEINFSTVNRNITLGEDISHQHLLKYKTIGKLENHAQTCRNKAILDIDNDHKMKKSAKNISLSSFVGIEPQERTSLREIKSYNEPKVPISFSKAEGGVDEHFTVNMSFPSKNMKEEGKNLARHKLSYTSEPQNSSNLVCGKDNDSGYLSEQELTEKTTAMPYEDFKVRRISELENNQSRAQMSSEKYNNKELLMKDSILDKMQLKFSEISKDQFLFQEHMQDIKAEKQKQMFRPNQEFQNCKDLEFCDANVISDDGTKKTRLLQLSVRECQHFQENVMNLERENTDLKNQFKPLTDIIYSLTEQNSNYQKEIKDLQEEKNNIQNRLVKSEGDCKECLKEVRRLLKKFKELQQQKASLEEKQVQLYAQNQSMIQEIRGFQKKDRQTQEDLALFRKEKNDLIVALATVEKQMSAVQEENKTLGVKICQVMDKNSLLGNELGEKQKELQRLKENGKTAVSDLDAFLVRMQLLNEEKRKLDETLQEALKDKQVLQKELAEVQCDKIHAEEKLLAECGDAKAEIGVLKTSLSNMETECERLKKVIEGITEGNWILKKQVHEYKKDALECNNKARQLSEELLLMENKMRNTENEREALKFEAHRLHKNNISLKDQITVLINAQSKQRLSSEKHHENAQPAHPTGICEEISRYEHISFIRNLSEHGKITEIRRKLKEEELGMEKRENEIKKLYSVFSVSYTTSVIRKRGFPGAS